MKKKYALVAEGDVFMTISFDDSMPQTEAWIAGLASSPVIIEITDNPDVNNIRGGWTWDGTSFRASE